MFSLMHKSYPIFQILLFPLLLLSSPVSYSYVNGSAAYCLFYSIEDAYPEYFPRRGSTEKEESWSDGIGYIRSYNDNKYYGRLLVYRDAVYYSFYSQDWVYFSDFKTADNYFSNGYCNDTFGGVATSRPNTPDIKDIRVYNAFTGIISFRSFSNKPDKTATGFYFYKYVNNVWIKIGTRYNTPYGLSFLEEVSPTPSTYYYAIAAYNSVGVSDFIYVTLNVPEWTSHTTYFGRFSYTSPTGKTPSSSSGNSSTTQDYNIVSPYIDRSSNEGSYTGTQKNDIYQVESGDFNNQFEIVIGGDDIIQFPSKLNVQQNVILHGVVMNAYNRNPTNVSNLRRNGNDLYFQYNTGSGNGTVTIKNYFSSSNASQIQLIPMFNGENYSAIPWKPIL